MSCEFKTGHYIAAEFEMTGDNKKETRLTRFECCGNPDIDSLISLLNSVYHRSFKEIKE